MNRKFYKKGRSQDGSDDEQPLLTAAAERTAEQHAMLRSLTPSHTGLAIKTHNRLIGLLVQIVSYFSDGTDTSVRVAVIANSLHKSRATIFRALADAHAVGFMASESREGTVGQTISSDRSIDWAAIASRLGRQVPSWAKQVPTQRASTVENSPANDVRRPRLNCDTPVSTETPPVSTETPPSQLRPLIEHIDPNRPDRTERNPRSGLPDKRTKRIFQSAELGANAIVLFGKLGYRGSEGQTLWLAVAALAAGIVTEADLSDAIAAVRAIGPRDPVAYFRRVLADRLELDDAGMRAMFASLRILPRCPSERPISRVPPTAAVSVPVKRPSPIDRDPARDLNQRSILLQQQIRTIEQCKS